MKRLERLRGQARQLRRRVMRRRLPPSSRGCKFRIAFPGFSWHQPLFDRGMKPRLRHRLLLVSGAALAIAFAGCATSSTYKVKVDAITKPVASANAVSYKLKSKDPRLGEENLRYREAAEFVRTAL